MFKALLVEIKNSITKTFFHLIRFGGLLIIPFIYGFSYIYAFYDPFSKADEVKVSLITDKGDALGERLGKQLSKENELTMGEMEMTLKMEHIYADAKDPDGQYEQVKKDSYATIKLSNTDAIEKAILHAAIAVKQPGFNIGNAFGGAIAMIGSGQLAKVTLNYKKNYLLAFGVDTSSHLYSSAQFIEEQLIKAMNDDAYINNLLSRNQAIAAGKITAPELKHMLTALENYGLSQFHPVEVKAHMGGENAKYGYGLAPFFISVAMWVGGMVMTFAVHRKIYDKTISAGKRYFAKWLVIVFGVIAQATILMFALYLIGFDKLGLTNWTQLYIGAIVSGMVFASVIQAIRFAIHNRAIGILLTIMLLVLQMASGGGLFPIETQSGFYQVVNKIVPMGRSVKLLRELAFETNWSNVMIDFGYMAIWLLMIPIGIVINHYRTLRIYKSQNWDLPETMAYRENIRQAKIAKRKARRANRKGGA